MTTIDLSAELAALKAENEALKAKKNPPITLKVSEKGALSVYGIGRFPVSLYAQQWERVLNKAEDIRTFMAANKDKLTVKA